MEMAPWDLGQCAGEATMLFSTNQKTEGRTGGKGEWEAKKSKPSYMII